jgi:hypothetical protein
VFVATVKAASENKKTAEAQVVQSKALKQDDVSPAKKPNQDYTNFEKSGSTLSANATLSSKDKQDIAELEKRLNALKRRKRCPPIFFGLVFKCC